MNRDRQTARLGLQLRRLLLRAKTSDQSAFWSRVALAVSLAGLLVAAATFYITRLREPRLEVVVASRVFGVYPGDLPASLQFNWPIAISNNSERGGRVIYCALLFRRLNDGSYRYLPWNYFLDDKDGKFSLGALAHPFPIAARSTEVRTVTFWWSEPNGAQPYLMIAGKYEFSLLIWTADTPKPQIVSSHVIDVSPNLAMTITEQHRVRQSRERQCLERLPIDFELSVGSFLHGPQVPSSDQINVLLRR